MFEEVLFLASDELVGEVIGLVDEADDAVGGDVRRAGFEIGPIGLIGRIVIAA